MNTCTCMLPDTLCLFKGSKDPFLTIPIDGPKVTAALWGPLDQYIITGHENGDLCQWDTKVRVRLLQYTVFGCRFEKWWGRGGGIT